MSRVRGVVDALARVAARFTPADRVDKLALLDQLATRVIAEPSALVRFHEALCFLQAYPDDPELLARVDRALAQFSRRVTRLAPAAAARLADSGIAGTILVYPFGLPMTRWLISRFPRDVEVAWAEFTEEERLEEALALLVTPAEGDAFSEGGMGWRRWLREAKGGRPLTDLQLLVELFAGVPLPQEARNWLFESVELPIRWWLRDPAGSRTCARLPGSRPFFGEIGVSRGRRPFVEEVRRPLRSLDRAPRPVAESLIQAARAAMASRLRELYGFSHANPEDVLLVDPGWGIRIALIGLLPEFRLPVEGYYAFFVLKNGVPVGYGGGWYLFGTLELGLNVFESFRQGRSAFLFSQILRAYRRALGIRAVVVDPYQIGHDNPEALRSGAFYFYFRLGFRPRDAAVRRLAEQEQAKIERDRSYRSPVSILRRLAQSEIALALGDPGPERQVRASDIAGLVSRYIAREFRGDRRAAAREVPQRVARALGETRWKRWPRRERAAFARLSPVAAVIPDLARWPAADRRRLVEAFRARGDRSELPYAKLLDRHRRLRRSLEVLTASGVGGSGVTGRAATSLRRGEEPFPYAG